jgi:hypothetical protein
MAKVTTGKRAALRMDDLFLSTDGEVTASRTNVRVTFDNGDYTDFGGSYTFVSPTQFTGTVTSITQVVGGKTIFSVSDVNADAQTLFGFLDAGDIQGAEAYVLRGKDLIEGNALDDVLYGFGGADTINGNSGNDELTGGLGRDKLNGGLGADTFFYNSVKESGVGVDLRDTIYGFSHAQGDKIDLSAIDANSKSEINNSFKFVAAFSGKAGELTVSHVDAGWLVLGETNGKAGADFSILVKSDVALVASDFNL